MSDNSRHTMFAILEATFPITPSNPDFARLRATGATLGLTKGTNASEEQRGDRQMSDFRHTTNEAGGEVNFELSFGSQETLLEAALGSTFAIETYTDTDIAIVEDGSGDQLVLTTGTWADKGVFFPGQDITLADFVDGANNGSFIVDSVSGGTLVVVSTDMVAEAAGANATVSSDDPVLHTGLDRTSLTIVRHFTDQVDAEKPYHVHTGMEVNTMTLTVTPDARVTGTFGFLGQNIVPKDDTEWATLLGSGSLGTPSTTKTFDAFTGSISVDGVANQCVTEISLSLENGLEQFFIVFDKQSKRPSSGISNLTGTIAVRFDDADLLEKFYNEQEVRLEFNLVDLAGNEYEFIVPTLKFTGGQPDSEGSTGPIVLTIPFQAYLNDDSGTNLVIVKKAV